MKRFIVYSTNAIPYAIFADTYCRDGDFIQFFVAGEVVKSVSAQGLLTVVEDKESKGNGEREA